MKYVYLVGAIIGIPLPLVAFFITSNAGLIGKTIVSSFIGVWCIYQYRKEKQEAD